MKRKRNGERGMSLVEVTIILMTLAILTAVAAPTIGDYVSEARQTKAKEDVEALGTSILRMVRDVGGGCLKLSATAACTLANRVEILRSTNTDITGAFLASTATDYAPPTAADIVHAKNWDQNLGANADSFDDQLVTNEPNYNVPPETTPSGYTVGGPSVVGIGWRGAYIGNVGSDPWGLPYLANTVFLRVATDATAGTLEGNKSGGWSRDAIVISAGPNGLFDTPYGGSANGGTNRLSDDVTFIIAGDTR